MTDPAQAFLNYGNVDQWTRGAGPITGIGTTMGHGSWPIYEAPEKPTSWRVFWRNPDTRWNLLRDIFLFATLECVAAARYPAP